MSDDATGLRYRVLHLLKRVGGGFLRKPWLHALSIVTLAAAFLSFGATLTTARNIDQLIDRWCDDAQMTVYVKPGTADAQVRKLARALKAIDGVAAVSLITPEQAHAEFTRTMAAFEDVDEAVSPDAFPPTIDVRIDETLAQQAARRHALADRIAKVRTVESVEVYDDWFARLDAARVLGRTAAWGLGALALVVTLLIVAATVRAGIQSRSREIGVLRYVGATERYVRLPFLLEGAIEALVAMAIAVAALAYLMDRAEQALRHAFPLLGGALMAPDAATNAALLAGAALAGLAGAHLSVRRIREE